VLRPFAGTEAGDVRSHPPRGRLRAIPPPSARAAGGSAAAYPAAAVRPEPERRAETMPRSGWGRKLRMRLENSFDGDAHLPIESREHGVGFLHQRGHVEKCSRDDTGI